MEWQKHGAVGAVISPDNPGGNQYIVLPNCESGKWEVYVSRNSACFERMDDRTWHTEDQAKAWAEGSEQHGSILSR